MGKKADSMNTLSPETLQYLQREAEKLCRKGNSVGAECAIFTEDQLLFSYDYGKINKAKSLSSTMDSLYMIGSNTKMMTAMCCMKLMEEGKLDLLEDIRTYLPEFTVKTRNARITVQDLLQHRSGLQGDFWGLTRDQGMDAVLEAIKNTELSYEPGTEFSYSNVGYTVLGLLIERLSGRSYENYVRKTIGEPLGIRICFEKEDQPEFSCAYDQRGRETEDFVASMPGVSAGPHTYLSMRDFIRFCQVLLNHGAPILKSETMALMESLPLREPKDSQLLGYGYGMIHNHLCFPEVTVLGHGGDTSCHHSAFHYVKELNTGFAVMTNSASGVVLAGKLEILMLERLLKDEGLLSPVPVFSTRNMQVSREILGSFASPLGPLEIWQNRKGQLQGSLKGMHIHLRPAGEGWLQCIPIGASALIPGVRKNFEHFYIKPARYLGKVVLLAQSGKTNFFCRSILAARAENAPIHPAFLTAQGTYEPADLRIRQGMPMTLKLKARDGKLLVSSRSQGQTMQILLRSVSDSEAVIQGFGRFSGEHIILNSEENTVQYAGITFHKIK